MFTNIKEADVWAAARRYGGVSVRYGKADIYEIILPGRCRQCCIVISSSPQMDQTTIRTACYISKLRFRISNKETLDKVLNRLAKGEFNHE